MPIYTIKQGGKIYEIQAKDEGSALSAIPGTPQQSKAYQDISKVRGKNTVSDQVTGAMSLGLQNLTNAGIAALGSQAPRLMGKDPGYGVGEAFQAARNVERDRSDEFSKAHPVQNVVGGLLGGLAMPGGQQLAKLATPAAKGLLGLGEAMLRGGGIGATLGGAYGGATSRPGDELKDIKRGGITGGVVGAAVPAATAAAGAVGRSVSGAGRTAVRAANKASGGQLLNPTREAGKRLVEAMRADGMDEAVIRATQNEMLRTGVTPTLLDIVSANGGGQNTRALIRGAAMTGPARNTASRYADQVVGDLQDNAIGLTRKLTPDTRGLPEIEAGITSRISDAAQAPEFRMGQGGVDISDALGSQFNQQRSVVNSAYDAARQAAPESAYLQEHPRFAANIRDAVKDFDPQRVPAVARELDRLDTLSTPNMRDIFELRTRLGNLRGSSDAVEASAAGRAVKALDSQIDESVQRGTIAGDPEVVSLWRNAIGERRKLGQAFEGDDMVNKLTEQTLHGSGRANAIAPEDASSAMLGRTGVSQRPNSLRDLTRIRDMLGEDSAAWRSLQSETLGRVLGPDAGSENFGRSLDKFMQQSPELADLLLPRGAVPQVRGAQEAIQGAVGDRGALNTGRNILSTFPDEFSAAVSPDRMGLTQVGAARSIENTIGAPAEGSTGALNKLATNTNTGRNLETTFGAEPAQDFRTGMGHLIDQTNNARFINPNTGSQTAGRAVDQQLVDGIPTPKLSILGLLSSAWEKIQRGATLTDQERQALVEMGISSGSPAQIAPQLAQPGRQQFQQTGARLAPALALSASGER